MTKTPCIDCCEVVPRDLAIYQRDHVRPSRCGWCLAQFYKRK